MWGPQALITLSLRNAHFTFHFELSWPNARQKTGVKKVFTRLKPAPPLTSVQSQPVHYQERINNCLHNIDYITQYAMNRELFSEFCEVENFAKLSQKELAMIQKFSPRKKNHLAMTSKKRSK
jgi:ERCC4-type nuclease